MWHQSPRTERLQVENGAFLGWLVPFFSTNFCFILFIFASWICQRTKNGAQKTWNQFNIKIPPDRKPYRQNRLEKPDSSLEPECRTYLCPTGGNAWCFTTPVSTTATATTSTTTNTTSATTTNNTISTTLLHNTSLQHIFQHSSCIHVLCVYGRWWVVVGFTLKTSTKRSEDQQQEMNWKKWNLAKDMAKKNMKETMKERKKQKKESAAGRLQNTNETRKNHLTCNVWKRRFLYKRIQWRQSFSGSTWIWGVKVFAQLFNNGYERSWSTLVSNWSKFLGNQVEFRDLLPSPWNPETAPNLQEDSRNIFANFQFQKGFVLIPAGPPVSVHMQHVWDTRKKDLCWLVSLSSKSFLLHSDDFEMPQNGFT